MEVVALGIRKESKSAEEKRTNDEYNYYGTPIAPTVLLLELELPMIINNNNYCNFNINKKYEGCTIQWTGGGSGGGGGGARITVDELGSVGGGDGDGWIGLDQIKFIMINEWWGGVVWHGRFFRSYGVMLSLHHTQLHLSTGLMKTIQYNTYTSNPSDEDMVMYNTDDW